MADTTKTANTTAPTADDIVLAKIKNLRNNNNLDKIIFERLSGEILCYLSTIVDLIDSNKENYPEISNKSNEVLVALDLDLVYEVLRTFNLDLLDKLLVKTHYQKENISEFIYLCIKKNTYNNFYLFNSEHIKGLNTILQSLHENIQDLCDLIDTQQ